MAGSRAGCMRQEQPCRRKSRLYAPRTAVPAQEQAVCARNSRAGSRAGCMRQEQPCRLKNAFIKLFKEIEIELFACNHFYVKYVSLKVF
ncbi:hypothetical protein ElyMa_000621300 [Elysia marginata]|uniref:Uncharacterized protein n=1 Tax=Elysia marginata TaxID=1093978 RepID=A0AAV4G9Q0_9GAST|nr:hypothetical protein ElyMa_000621300 [Elysia marginata]